MHIELSNESSPKYRIPLNNTKMCVNIPKHDSYVLNDKDRDEVKELCIKNVPFWNTLNKEDMELDLFTWSITNITHKVTVKDQSNHFPINKVIVKKTTPYNYLLYDVDLQFEVAKLLGDNYCGPKVLSRNGFYIIIEFIEGSNISNLSFQNLSLFTSLASSLAKFHKKGTEIFSNILDKTPLNFRILTKWSKHVERIIEKHNIDMDYKELENYFDIYKRVINNHVNKSSSIANSIMFCHNDLFYKNVLDIQHGIYLIDFDYSSFNYVGWEIGYLFNMVNIFYDRSTPPYFSVDNNLLTEEMKRIFVSVYLSQLLDKMVLPQDNAVKEFLDNVEVHLLGSHLFHVYWNIMMTDKPVSEIVERLQCNYYLKFKYNQLKEQLKKLSDNNMIQY